LSHIHVDDIRGRDSVVVVVVVVVVVEVVFEFMEAWWYDGH
jgi:hypothetical protein